MGDKSKWIADGDEATKKIESLSYNREYLPVHRVVSTVFVGKQGYQRLDDAVTHSREIILNRQQRSFFIKDTLECQQVHSAERFWHFSEKCDISLADDGSVIAINEGQKITLKPLQAVTAKLYRGNEDKPLGWISRNYDVKEPTTTVVWMSAVNGTCTFDAVIECT